LLTRAGTRRVAVCLVLATSIAAGCIDFGDLVPAEEHRLLITRDHVPDEAPSRPDTLRVASYNIAFGEQVELALADLQRDIHLHDLDILLVQEMDPDGIRLMAETLEYNAVYYPAAQHHHHGKLFGNAVLSPWPITSSRLLVVPHPLAISGHRRIATVAELDIGGHPVRAVSFHAATFILGSDKCLDQFRAVADNLIPADRPVLIGGDFNTTTQYEMTLLRRIFRPSGCRSAQARGPATIKGWLPRLFEKRPVLDHIFYRELELIGSGVSQQAEGSDHLPVWAHFRWR